MVDALAHELPQEVGDFALLLDSGFSRSRALLWNLLSGAATIPGAILAYMTLGSLQGIMGPVLGLAAASFIYIGLADLVPGLHRRIGPDPGFAQFLLMLAGIGTILGLQLSFG
ncbi:MAG: ZIP family metal transporter [Nitrospira sp.]|nr:ZIP family metal transporter [Nitrospira sp.]